jgi:ribosomal protein S18 acetylase RimI-like enzyme
MRSLPLSEFQARHLSPLLDEEARHWEGELNWDYSEVSSAVAAGLDRRNLAGRVVLDDGRPAAYCYFIQESGRAVVGSLFATAPLRRRGLEEALLDDVLGEALADEGNTRVECQTLFSTSSEADACFGRQGFRSVGRHYLVRDLREPIPPSAAGPTLKRMRRDDLPGVADIIYESHRGSLDAALNLTYATPAHCRGFVDTLALRGGCGAFDTEASLLLETEREMAGVLLASRLSRRTGHICQVSVLPEFQGRGFGRLLITAALEALRRQGLENASLSVTVGNAVAYQLYERMGFRVRKAFAAHAWVRLPARIELPA